MKVLKDYLDSIEVLEQSIKMEEVFNWILENFPQLEVAIKWNQPMFTDHGTFIIGFSKAKNHMSFSSEEFCINIFSEEIKKSGYEHTKGLAKIKWTDDIDFLLLKRIIEFNISDKAECSTFFRK